jgi:menaquinone-specific isochorismate synthase
MTGRPSTAISLTEELALDSLAERIRQEWSTLADRGSHFHRLVIPVKPVDPLRWLSAQPFSTRIYWRSRDNTLESAAVGSALSVRAPVASETASITCRLLDQSHTSADTKRARLYGGFPFAPAGSVEDHTWDGFEKSTFVLPRFELTVRDGSADLACHITRDDIADRSPEDIIEELSRLQTAQERPKYDVPGMLSRIDRPAFTEWIETVKGALRRIQTGDINKIVLARQSELTFRSQLDPWLLLARLRDRAVNCYVFGFQFDDSAAFIGVSPERLYRRTGQQIESEALAGTRPRGVGEIDKQYTDELLHSDKDALEHKIVIDAVRASLESLCEQLTADRSVSVRKLARVQHLAIAFSGTLSIDVTDVDILSELHPTPAVCGFPVDGARREIARSESFDRGWYAGPVGWIGSSEADFAVGIRSALVRGNHLYLYSGAGVVEGSDPEAEWYEIEAKIDSFIQALTLA